MAIPFLGEIERLISEHGSAVILKERLALANDQYSALEGKLADARSRAEDLARDNERLRKEAADLREQLRALQERAESQTGDRLEEVRETILRFLSEHEDVTAAQIARAMGKHEQVVIFHLGEMEGQNLVQASYSAYEDTQWSIAHDGRGYLVRAGLIG